MFNRRNFPNLPLRRTKNWKRLELQRPHKFVVDTGQIISTAKTQATSTPENVHLVKFARFVTRMQQNTVV